MGTSATSATSSRIVIAGAGFAGLGLGVLLRQAGYEDFVILERAAEVGGVWRDNHYPGAACDIPAVLYSYSFEADYPWSGGYPRQAEILAYIGHVVRKYGLEPHLRCNRQVVAAEFDAARAQWSIDTLQGERFDADVFVPAVGIFNDPVVPRLPGIERFEGLAFHSTGWRHDMDYRGRHVAVVGTGASAVQIVPEMVRAGAEVTLYQRTAPYVVPKSVIATRQPLAERQRIFDEFEGVAGRRKDPAATQAAQDAFMRYLASQVPDPALRARLTPDFTLGCKRSLFSNDWYAALQQPNANVVTEGIECVTPSGIQARDGTQRRADVIVYATGFNPANYLPGMAVRGRDGVTLADAWRDGAEAHLGINIAGFPNLFLLYGPHTNVPGSVLFMLECQARYVVDALALRQVRSARSMEVREEVMRRFCDAQQAEIRETTQTAEHCQSYYMNAAGKVVTQFPGRQAEYRSLTARARADDFHFA